LGADGRRFPRYLAAGRHAITGHGGAGRGRPPLSRTAPCGYGAADAFGVPGAPDTQLACPGCCP